MPAREASPHDRIDWTAPLASPAAIAVGLVLVQRDDVVGRAGRVLQRRGQQLAQPQPAERAGQVLVLGQVDHGRVIGLVRPGTRRGRRSVRLSSSVPEHVPQPLVERFRRRTRNRDRG